MKVMVDKRPKGTEARSRSRKGSADYSPARRENTLVGWKEVDHAVQVQSTGEVHVR